MEKKTLVGINGFGRIGRAIFRQLFQSSKFEVVQINDLNPDIHNLCYLVNFDTLHGQFKQKAEVKGSNLLIDKKKIKVTNQSLITDALWHEEGVDIVIESSGFKPNIPIAKECIRGSVKKVLFSDSPEGMDLTLVHGVNENLYDDKKHHVISASICDVVGTAPLLKLIEDEFPIKTAFLQTLHPWLSYQNVMDSSLNQDVIDDPDGKAYGIGRSSTSNLIPKNTSLGKALIKILPSLDKKITGMSFRVPTEIVGSCSMILEIDREIKKTEITEYLSSKENIPIMQLSYDPIVSSDIKYHDSSCVVDMRWLEIMNNKLRLVTWYDNEWGYVNRFCDTLSTISINK